MRSLIFAAAVLFAPSAFAQTAQELLVGLAGEWEGALGYRDYQSNELFELEVVTTIALSEDGRTLIRTSRFDEGDAPDVFIVSMSSFDDTSGLYETAGFRAGRAMYVTRESVEAREVRNDTHWALVFTERGMDDDRAADIRITLTRTGDDTLAVKEVDYLDDPAVAWEFRNQTRLRRVR
jgi:hypothetical protein